MIRIFNLFCKLKEIKISDQEWFGQAFRRLSLSAQSCPYCNSKGNLIPHDSYSRYMVSLKDNSPVTVILRVPRVKCTSCGHTHALLPEMLIPYVDLEKATSDESIGDMYDGQVMLQDVNLSMYTIDTNELVGKNCILR